MLKFMSKIIVTTLGISIVGATVVPVVTASAAETSASYVKHKIE